MLFLILVVLILFPSSGCFQLSDTILGKSFESQLAGSLVFRGKISDQWDNKEHVDSVSLLRGKHNWERNSTLKLKPSFFNSDNWTDVTVTARFKKEAQDDRSCKEIFGINATYIVGNGNSDPFLPFACIPAPRLILHFNYTNDTEWSVCTSKSSPSNFAPVTTPSTVAIVSGAMGVVCLLLVVVLTVTCVCLQRVKGEIQEHHPQPLSTTDITHPPGQFLFLT